MSGASFLLFLGHFLCFNISAQITLEGVVVDASTYEKIENVEVSIEGSTFKTLTDTNGHFSFSNQNLPSGNQVLLFLKPGDIPLRLPVIISDTYKDLDLIPLQRDMMLEQSMNGIISLSDAELSEDEGSIESISGLLQATRDVFLNPAAFDFSATFFRYRGFDSEHGKLLINWMEMNKLFNGRPQWGTWGGLNHVRRNQVFSMVLTSSEVSFGGLSGTTNIIMRASAFSKGGRVCYAAANRSYKGRIMGTYNSGEMSNGWAYSVSASRRFAEEGYNDGSLYDPNSLFISVGKEINENHSLNVTGFYTPNIRGKSSANTQEVFDLKGRRYNSFWGYQEGEIRNSRTREIKEPVLMLNHFWKLTNKLDINNNRSYQFGKIGKSRIDFGGTREVFKPGTLGGNRHVRISAYRTQEAPLEAWLVAPGIGLDKSREEVLSFDVRSSFDNAIILRVYTTNEYSGNPLTTNWNLLDAQIPLGPSNQAATNFKRSLIDISCMDGTINVAFRYMGGVPDKTTTYDIDNVRVTGK